MLDPKIQEALDKIPTVNFTNLDTITRIGPDIGITDMGYNGISAQDISQITTNSVPTLTSTPITGLTTVQLSAIGGNGGYTLATGTGTGTSLNWQSPTYTTSAIGAITAGGKAGQLNLKGEDADLVINGKSVVKLLERIEERLNLLEPNIELEKEWDDLKKLGDRYRKLEKKCKEKAETWKKLKAMPPPQMD